MITYNLKIWSLVVHIAHAGDCGVIPESIISDILQVAREVAVAAIFAVGGVGHGVFQVDAGLLVMSPHKHGIFCAGVFY